MINHSKGFTLMELMVVVAIIGIISAIAYPSYQTYMYRSRRSDAKVALTKIVNREERYYLQNNSYTTSFAVAGLSMPTTSSQGYYSLSVTAPTPVTGYTATATATGAQASDTGCTVLTLSSTGVKTPTACW